MTWWAFLVGTSLALFPVAVLVWTVTAPVDPRRRVLHRFTCLWASLYTWLNPAWTVTVEGREKIRPGATYVMIANHRSFADILVLFRLFVHFKWVSKIEMFRIPCIGWNMRLNGYVPLRRGDAGSIADMMARCRRALAAGNSIMMFPEGSRSLDGRLKPFKHGAFTLAHEARAPLLPIVVEGTFEALPARGLVLGGPRAIHLRVLDEIPYADFADWSVEALTAHAHALYRRELGEVEASPARTAARAVGATPFVA
jgi:1-acyl-sn-glycerol-3-phosphate acyltransferase